MDDVAFPTDMPIVAPGPALLKKKHFLGRFPLTSPSFDPEGGDWKLQPEPTESSAPSNSIPRSWVLDNPHGKPPQRGVMEGGMSGAASYFVLVQQEQQFVALPVENWFNFKPLRAVTEGAGEQADGAGAPDAAGALFASKLVPKSVQQAKELQEGDEGGPGQQRKRRRGGSGGADGGLEDDEAPEDLYQGEEDELRPERPEQAEDWEHEHNVDDDDEEMGDELEEKLEDDPGERKKLGLEDDEEEELDEAGRTIKKLVDRQNAEGSDEESPEKAEGAAAAGGGGEDGANDDELDEMDEETMDLDEVFKDDDDNTAPRTARTARAASPAPGGRASLDSLAGAGAGAAAARKRTPPPGARRAPTPPPGAGGVALKRKADGAAEEQAKKARTDAKPGPAARAPVAVKTEMKSEPGAAGTRVKVEPSGTKSAPAAAAAAGRKPAAAQPAAAAAAAAAPGGLPTPDEIKQVVGQNRYSVKALISHFKGRIRKEDTGLFQKTVLSVAKLSKGADGQSYLELK